MATLIVHPGLSQITYLKAAEVFQDLFSKITGIKPELSENDDGVSDLVVIGSDSVNDFLMGEVQELRIGSLGIRYGTDDYCIRTYKKDDRRVLILAGGRGRSTLYAVYDYFERFAGCHYFWDGDVIPACDHLPMENIQIRESPRFFYRGLRYFAHRGLKRFQAEHWSFEDWKQELDWLVKRRLNFFMMRIGMDDVWQRAFPDDVPYPEDFRTIDGVDAEGYNDRSDFWTLKYKGDLKAKVLAYARDLDLMYPTDCGTMTHWYSRTPVEFLEKRKPTFTHQVGNHYIASDTGKVFDFTKKENMDYYMHLTDTMVENYEKSTELFHTIGLGERHLFTDRRKNLAMKLIAYRRIAENIRQRYPQSKLMLASWDFCGFWPTDEVAELFRELDPERTILLDYTSDMNDPDHSFLQWGVQGKFPYIFGMFHAYESESELRGPYHRSEERLRLAAEDPYCKGMILWPELAHSDPLVLEYLTKKSWSPFESNIEQITEEFSGNRYGQYADTMNKAWQNILPFNKLGEWGGEGAARPYEDKGVEICQCWYMHSDIWVKLTNFLDGRESKREDLRKYYRFKEEKSLELADRIITALDALTEQPEALDNPFVLRDSVDIVRTVLSRFLNFTVINALNAGEDKARICQMKTRYMDLLEMMSQVLRLNPDFSVWHTLQELRRAAQTNPNFEITLKRNISNDYCAQHAMELVENIYRAEGEAAFQWMLDGQSEDNRSYRECYRRTIERFLNEPLENMQHEEVPDAVPVIRNTAKLMRQILDQ